MSGLHIDWLALGRVVAISAVVGLAIVTVFSVGILGLSRADNALDNTGTASQRTTGYLVAATAHGLCIAAVLYGLYLLIPQFH